MAKKKARARKRIATRRRATKSSKRGGRRTARALALPAVVVGVVLSGSTGLPVGNAMVKVVGGTANFGKTTHTNAFGLYVLTNMTPERDLVEASKGSKVQEKDKIVSAPITILNFTI
jgi:predicted MFS family arabinose efflux permease